MIKYYVTSKGHTLYYDERQEWILTSADDDSDIIKSSRSSNCRTPWPVVKDAGTVLQDYHIDEEGQKSLAQYWGFTPSFLRCSTLEEVKAVLEAVHGRIKTQPFLAEILLEGDWVAKIPVFGTEGTPANLEHEVWSWDNRRVLVSSGRYNTNDPQNILPDDFRIIPRKSIAKGMIKERIGVLESQIVLLQNRIKALKAAIGEGK